MQTTRPSALKHPLTLALSVSLLFVLSFPWLYRLVGPSAFIPMLIPVSVCGWLTDRWRGVAAGAATYPLRLILLSWVGVPFEGTVPFLHGAVMMCGAGFASGYVGELIARLRAEVTERRKVDAALIDSEKRFRGAFDHAHVGVALVEYPGRCLQVNPAFCKMLGYREDELITLQIQDLAHPDDAEHVCGLVKEMVDNGGSAVEAEVRYYHKHGHLIWALVSIAVVRSDDGSPAYLINQMQDITDRKRYEEQLRHQADHDSLTGLINRRRFREEMSRKVAEGRGAVLFIDLDGFKQVNDVLGHEAGDELLRDIAGVLRTALKPGEQIGRLGGDEFAMLLPNGTAERCMEVIAGVKETLSQLVVVIDGRPLAVTVSVGQAFYPDHGTTPEELLARADMAMYQVKESGRNGVVTYSPGLAGHGLKQERSHWETRIREALEHGGFELHGQPVLHLGENRVVWYELLLRLRGENGELISPASFLGIAERLGLIHAIDRWVVGEAVRMLQANPGLRVSVNLSGRSLSSMEVLQSTEEVLGSAGIDPSRLILEITETAAIFDLAGAGRFIERLRRLGCSFALDDFGAGFASFHQLKHLPVDCIKIYGELIRRLPEFPADQHVVRAIAEMARGLGTTVVAEYVEDEVTVRLLQECGVTHGQGYHLGRPGPLAVASPLREAGE